MAVNYFAPHKPVAGSLLVIQASDMPGLSHVIAVTGNGLNCWVEDRRKHEPKIRKSHKRNPYSRMKDICLWSHIALTRALNICMYSLPLPLIAYELLSTQISHLNIIIRLKPKQRVRKYNDMYSQLQILLHRVSTYSGSYMKRIHLESDV
jgi:hypothetical protein